MYLTLDRIKKHLNIDEDYKEDDEYILALCEVSEQVVERHIDSNLSEVAKSNGDELPSPLLHAMLLFIGDMYRTRESVSFTSVSAIPFSYDYILSLYKNYGTGELVSSTNGNVGIGLNKGCGCHEGIVLD